MFVIVGIEPIQFMCAMHYTITSHMQIHFCSTKRKLVRLPSNIQKLFTSNYNPERKTPQQVQKFRHERDNEILVT